MSVDPNSACCTNPPVVVEGYEPKGEYKPYAGFEKAYITGPKDTGKAIVVAYDAFGFNPQILQAVDIWAKSVNALVVVPDFFNGDVPEYSWFVEKTEENDKKRTAWFIRIGNFALHVEPIWKVSDALTAEGYKKIGYVGYCWGGKLVSLGGKDGTKTAGVVSIHGGRIEVADAEALAVPIAMFPSKDESETDVDNFMKALESKPFASQCVHKRYSNMPHGWAAARGNLKDEENLKAYEDVVSRTSTFFNGVLVV